MKLKLRLKLRQKHKEVCYFTQNADFGRVNLCISMTQRVGARGLTHEVWGLGVWGLGSCMGFGLEFGLEFGLWLGFLSHKLINLKH